MIEASLRMYKQPELVPTCLLCFLLLPNVKQWLTFDHLVHILQNNNKKSGVLGLWISCDKCYNSNQGFQEYHYVFNEAKSGG